jgi:hypothetical protein
MYKIDRGETSFGLVMTRTGRSDQVEYLARNGRWILALFVEDCLIPVSFISESSLCAALELSNRQFGHPECEGGEVVFMYVSTGEHSFDRFASTELGTIAFDSLGRYIHGSRPLIVIKQAINQLRPLPRESCPVPTVPVCTSVSALRWEQVPA